MRRSLFALSVLGLSCTTHLFAADPVFTIQQGVLGYRTENTKSTPSGGTASKDKATNLYTMPNNLVLYATLDKIAFYVYPTLQGVPVGIGYYLKPDLELGLNLGLGSSNVDSESNNRKETSSSQTIAPYVTYYKSVGATQLELSYSLSLTSASRKTTDKATGAVSTDTKTSGMGHFVNVLALYPLAKNFFYGAGFDYTMSSSKDSKGTKEKVDTTALNLNLATFRFNF